MAEGATVTVCHHLTREVALHSRVADAVLIAVGKPGLLKGDMIRQGSAVIDIGINQVKDDEGKSRIVGDCDYTSCREVAGWITPVPGGVGSGDSSRADAQYGCCCRSPQGTIPRADDRPSLDLSTGLNVADVESLGDRESTVELVVILMGLSHIHK